MKKTILAFFRRKTGAAVFSAVFLGTVLFAASSQANEGGGGGGNEQYEDIFMVGKSARQKRKYRKKARPSEVRTKAKARRKIRKRRVVRRAKRKKPVAIAAKRLDFSWWRRPLQQRYVPGEIILMLKAGAAPQAAVKIAREHGLRLVNTERNALLGERIYFFDYADARPVSGVVAALKANAGIGAVQPNYLYAEQGQSNNGAKTRGAYSLQYALKKLHVADAHEQLTGKNVVVAVIDSAVDGAHPELAGALMGSFNAISRGGARGGQPHGTGIASIIAARGQLSGVAPGVRLAAVRAFSRSGAIGPALSTTQALLKGLDWAFLQKARIFNLSFAGPKDPLFLKALEGLSARGAILIAAAGNEGAHSPALYPAADKNVIAVSAVDNMDRLFTASSRGKYVEVAAPGVDILVAAPGKRFGFLSGTSMAAAHVTGIAALVAERRPEISADDLRRILQETAYDLGPKGRDRGFGAGRVDAFSVVTATGK